MLGVRRHLCEFVVVDRAVTILIHFPDHLLNVLERHRLTHVNHDAAHLLGVDEAVPGSVEDREGRPERLLRLLVGHFVRHQRDKLGKVDIPCAISIRDPDHLLELLIGRVLPNRRHQVLQLSGIDGSSSILSERARRVSEAAK